MKYTKEYVANNKVAVNCNTVEEQLEVIHMLGEAREELRFGALKCSKVTQSVPVKLRNNYIVGIYDVHSSALCHTENNHDHYYSKNGFEIIPFSRFKEDNFLNYQIYQYEIY